MSDIVASVFRLKSVRLTMVPKTEFSYLESDTGVRWHISGGGSRAYLVRYGEGIASEEPDSMGTQNADSHFMVGRLLSALFLGAEGLFQAEAMGRFFIANVGEEVEWHTQLNLPTAKPPEASAAVYDWLGAFTRHTALRRAAADAHAALINPVEAGAMVYRGFEWLIAAEGRKWDDLAKDIGVSKRQMRDFKKLVNVDFGVRHASRSGQKLRADMDNYAYWVIGLLDAICATRERLDEDYTAATPEEVVAAMIAAVPVEPYA